MGNFPTLKLFQILALIRKCDLLICCREDITGILKYMMVWKPNWVASKDLLRRLGWSMMEEATLVPSPIEVPIGGLVKMNVLMWNCRGALNADFKRRIFEMVVNHHPAIMAITETRVNGERAKRIAEGLPFDGFYATDTIGYVGGLWLLWNKDKVEVFILSATEQEIHASMKVCNSNTSRLISSIYASPCLVERRILWSNLSKVAELHLSPLVSFRGLQ